MCLTINKDQLIPLIAEKDIVVDKIVTVEREFDISKIKHGDKFTAVINDIQCEGEIVIDDNIYFCTNDKNLEGDYCKIPKGYKYSWVLDKGVKKINIEGKKIASNDLYFTKYRDIPVKIGETYYSDFSIIPYFDKFTVEKGLHSFVPEQDLKGLGYFWDDYEVIVECVIPKGSKYYIGKFDNLDSYASDTLKYVKLK